MLSISSIPAEANPFFVNSSTPAWISLTRVDASSSEHIEGRPRFLIFLLNTPIKNLDRVSSKYNNELDRLSLKCILDTQTACVADTTPFNKKY
jgi:hypothetical protein